MSAASRDKSGSRASRPLAPEGISGKQAGPRMLAVDIGRATGYVSQVMVQAGQSHACCLSRRAREITAQSCRSPRALGMCVCEPAAPPVLSRSWYYAEGLARAPAYAYGLSTFALAAPCRSTRATHATGVALDWVAGIRIVPRGSVTMSVAKDEVQHRRAAPQRLAAISA
jgi:hypothetical protein